ncbi:MAG: ATP-dependent transcriptional regulator, MalT-like, LuxR family, partial [Solirubrobacterales bacterium]|nr:ATP-dependent transcriptional regulator, MalT-like, LuxR family [Solirubrobacterales bacterium]
MLRGRRSELELLDGLLEAVRDGESRVLVVRGEPGVGKSALLEYAARQASGFRAAHAAGVQSEIELPFAGLQQLCSPMLDHLERLPAPQRDALDTAFGLTDGTAPDRFLVALAVLSLLSEVAEERPLVCLVDDAQWLDRESVQAFEFVAGRLYAESVALVFAARPSGEEQTLAGLPELVVEGLCNGDARALLHSVVIWPLDERVRDRIIAETRGNPLALLELPRGLTPAKLAGGFGLPDPMPLASRIEESFQRRLSPLPADTRQLLLLAAAEPVGDSLLLSRAAERLGIASEAAGAAESDGLVEFGSRVTFRHPLVRSAIYRSASPRERRTAHRALADATDPEIDPDRRAWHGAQAAEGPDEAVAAELERSAGRAQARGGLAAAAAFLERSAALTFDSGRRAERALAAAQARAQAGEPDAALGLLAMAEVGPLDELERAQVDLLRAQVAFAVNRGSEVPPLLLAAAKRLESLDIGLARETYLDALWAALFVGRLTSGAGLLDVAQAARGAPPSSQPPRTADALLDGLALLVAEGHTAGAPTLVRALTAFRSERMSRADEIRWLHIACRAAVDLWDDESWNVLATRHVQLARDAGALNELPIALNTRIGVHLNAGELTAAASLIEEVDGITKATGTHVAPYGALGLAAWQGREAEAFELFEASLKEVVSRGEGVGLTVIEWASAQVYNSLGRYEDALAAAQQSTEHPEELLFATWGLVELIEAATRTGKAALATDALERLAQTTRATGTDWGLGIEARSRALLSEGEAAERLYREAIERLGRSRVRVALARAHLVYGEWLRRERRRTDAREQLRTAHEMFMTMGADGFAERARRELLATGETARKRTVETRSQLTPQETQVAQLARDGLSNPEIGARLFISPSTVQYHLRKVFMKLDINSRMQLARALPSDP